MKYLQVILDFLASLARKLMSVFRFMLRHAVVLVLVLGFSMATVTFPVLFGLVSSLAEFTISMVSDGPDRQKTARNRAKAVEADLVETRADNTALRGSSERLGRELADKQVDNTMLRATADFQINEATALRSDIAMQADELAGLRNAVASRQSEAVSMRRRIAQLEADRLVSFDGRMVPVRQAVSETADRVSRRVTVSTTRNIGSMAGESLPWIGIGVVASATAWEVKDACDLMKDMHKLDVAFNPDNAIEDGGVCGQTPPTREELWLMVKSSPRAAWEKAAGLYDGLRETSFDEVTNATANWTTTSFGSVKGWFVEAPE